MTALGYLIRTAAVLLLLLVVVTAVLAPADPPLAIEDPATETVVLWQGAQ